MTETKPKPATDEEIPLLQETEWCGSCDRLLTRIEQARAILAERDKTIEELNADLAVNRKAWDAAKLVPKVQLVNRNIELEAALAERDKRIAYLEGRQVYGEGSGPVLRQHNEKLKSALIVVTAERDARIAREEAAEIALSVVGERLKYDLGAGSASAWLFHFRAAFGVRGCADES